MRYAEIIVAPSTQQDGYVATAYVETLENERQTYSTYGTTIVAAYESAAKWLETKIGATRNG